MDLREYVSIRRAYNLVRQDMSSDRRLTFAELAILCRMCVQDQPMNTSDIAEYQGTLRPTMTHRTKHLAKMGLLERQQGSVDRRNVVCAITEEGTDFVGEVSEMVCQALRTGQVLSRTTPQRICRYVDAMGSVNCMSADLVLLGIALAEGKARAISDLVQLLGLLQPTVSMSASMLVEDGLVARVKEEGQTDRIQRLVLTEEGKVRADELSDRIKALVVRRK